MARWLRSNTYRLSVNRRGLERWSAVFGGCALAGAFYHYATLTILVPGSKGAFGGAIHAIVDGQADAPYQYRFLVPCVLVWLTDHAHLALDTAASLVDGVALATGAVIGVAMLRRSGLGLYAWPALLYCGLLILGPTAYYKPETMVAFACTTAALLALERRPPTEGWWSSRAVWPALVIATLVLIGCRTDLLFALGVGFAVRWRKTREQADLVAATALLAVGVVATVALVHAYPDAHYPRGLGVVQLAYNVDSVQLCVLGFFLAAAIGPLIAVRGATPLAVAARAVASERLPVIALIATEVTATLVVGKIDEIRLIFPVGLALAWVGADVWRAVLSSVEIEERPRSMTME